MSRELTQETLAEIEEELLSGEYAPLADRIHAAWERERVEIATKAATQGVKLTNEKFADLPIGNMAAVREALKNLTRFAESDVRQLECLAKRAIDNDIYGGGILQALCGAIREGKSALDLPPRNCDVGTAEEQAERFYSFCKKFQSDIQGMCSSRCPCKECCDMCHCLIKWEQIPYEEGGAK